MLQGPSVAGSAVLQQLIQLNVRTTKFFVIKSAKFGKKKSQISQFNEQNGQRRRNSLGIGPHGGLEMVLPREAEDEEEEGGGGGWGGAWKRGRKRKRKHIVLHTNMSFVGHWGGKCAPGEQSGHCTVFTKSPLSPLASLASPTPGISRRLG